MTITYNKQVLLKRGNTAVSSTYIGPIGEITINTDTWVASVHDGNTAGGHDMVSTANSAMETYVDTQDAAITAAWQANATTQLNQVTAANAAIVTANTAMKSYVDGQITNISGGAPAILDTLNEIANALGSDANLSTTITTLISGVQGNVTAANAAIVTANTALKSYVDSQDTAITSAWQANALAQLTAIDATNTAITTANTAMKSYVDSQDTAITSAWQANAETQLTAITNITNGTATFGNIIPSANVTYSLGNITHQWQDLFVSNNTIYLNGIPLSIDGSGDLLINGNLVNASSLINGAAIMTLSSTGVLDLPAGGVIKARADENLEIRISDTTNDGYRLDLVVDDGVGNTLSRVELDNNGFAVVTDVQGISNQWSFTDNGYLNIPGDILRYGGNVALYTIDVGAGSTYTSIESRSYINDNVYTTIKAETAKASITTDVTGTPQTWVFDNVGNITLPTNMNFSSSPAVSTTGIKFGDNTFQHTAWTGAVEYGSILNIPAAYGDTEVAAYLLANPQGSTYGDANVASYLTASGYATTSDISTANTAMQSYVNGQITSIINGAPGALDTLNELATALGGDANLSVTLTNLISGVQGNVTAANAAIITANTAMKSYVDSQDTAITSAWQANATAQLNQITAANAAIITANTAMKSYVDGLTYSNVQVASYLTANPPAGTYSNTNVASYLPGYSGSISSATVNSYNIGYRDIPQIALSGNTTITTSDAGKHYYLSTSADYTLTVATNAAQSFNIGAAINVINQGTGNITVAPAVGVTMYMAGNSVSGSRTISSYGMATLNKVATDTWFIVGVGLD